MNDDALMTASGAMPVTPRALTSPEISPSTAVPWSVSVLGVPATTPPWLARRSSCVKRQPHSQSITRTPAPRPPGWVQAQRASMPPGAGSR
ncbi:hypothetical protein [Serinibacter arcticus]|uniref:hypothetical protein n=1 Tax=Serinibacter arcticus TaxID=1655435 RepID=UPI0018EEC1C7|nr:hypothetical protein [Serinibacter arcticus]